MDDQTLSVVDKLNRYLADVQRGLVAVGLRRQMTPEIWERAHHVLIQGGLEELEQLWRGVASQSLGLLAGSSAMGGQAVEAFGQIQAQAYLDRRDSQDMPSRAAVPVLRGHRDGLFAWVEKGRGFSEGDDLSQVGSSMLTEPALRAVAASPFLAATQVLIEVMGIFSSPDETRSPIQSSLTQPKG